MSRFPCQLFIKNAHYKFCSLISNVNQHRYFMLEIRFITLCVYVILPSVIVVCKSSGMIYYFCTQFIHIQERHLNLWQCLFNAVVKNGLFHCSLLNHSVFSQFIFTTWQLFMEVLSWISFSSCYKTKMFKRKKNAELHLWKVVLCRIGFQLEYSKGHVSHNVFYVLFVLWEYLSLRTYS